MTEAKIDEKSDLGIFKKKYLLKAGFKDKKQVDDNRQAIIQLATSISSILENVKDKDNVNVSQEELFKFITGLLENDNFKKFMK